MYHLLQFVSGSQASSRLLDADTVITITRLFMPVLSDDTKHDKALSSRALALNRLDLSLDHLGVKTKEGVRERDETVAKGLENIVVEVGKGQLSAISNRSGRANNSTL